MSALGDLIRNTAKNVTIEGVETFLRGALLLTPNPGKPYVLLILGFLNAIKKANGTDDLKGQTIAMIDEQKTLQDIA